MMLPTAKSDFLWNAATAVVANSGSDVPAASIVKPISLWLTPKLSAIFMALSTII